MSRVVLFSNSLRVGGSERNVATYARCLPRYGYEPEVWVLHGGGEYESSLRAAGIPVRDLGRRRSYSPLFALRAARAVAKSDAELFHVFHSAALSYAVLAKRLFGWRGRLCFYVGSSSHDWTRKDRCYRPLIRGECDAWSANSPDSRDRFIAMGIERDRIDIIPNGHDPTLYVPQDDSSALREKLGIRTDDPVLFFCGRLIASKGVPTLIQATQRLVADHPRLKFLIAGDGPQRESLSNLVERMQLQNHVQFLGARDDIPQLLNMADAFVFASETEGLPNSVIEASLARLPIVAADIPGTAAVVRDDMEGLLVPPGDVAGFASAISRVLEDDKLRKRLSKAAYERAKNCFDVDASMRALCRFYDKALATDRSQLAPSDQLVA